MTAAALHHHDDTALLQDIALSGTGNAFSARVQAEIDQILTELKAVHRLSPRDPAAGPGPWRLDLSPALNGQQALELAFTCTATGTCTQVSLPLAPLRRHIADYGLMLESFYNAAKSGDIHRLEAVDAGRRGVHDDAAAELAEIAESKLRLDKPTARRLFSLLYILSKRQSALL